MVDDKISVLYIDDERANLRSFNAIFRKSNFKIFTATTLENGLEVLEHNKIHILITDYEMPIHKGDYVLKVVLSIYPDIIPVVLSAYLTIETKEKLSGLFDGITLIEKPFDIKDLTNIIIRLFKGYQYTM
jgi:DNA-binding NtrC family response regulator